MLTIDTSKAIWDQYHQALLDFIRKRINSMDDAEDILQDVFIKIHRKLHTLEDHQKLESWLYQITRNTITDYYRKHKPYQPLPDEIANLEEEKMLLHDLQSCLRPMIEQLPETYQQAVFLSELEGLPQAKVAEIQNISLSGAKSRVQRGRGLLKEMLLQCCEIEINRKNQVIDYVEKEGCINNACEGSSCSEA